MPVANEAKTRSKVEERGVTSSSLDLIGVMPSFISTPCLIANGKESHLCFLIKYALTNAIPFSHVFVYVFLGGGWVGG